MPEALPEEGAAVSLDTADGIVVSQWIALYVQAAIDSLETADADGTLGVVPVPWPIDDVQAASVGAMMAIGLVAQIGEVTVDQLNGLIIAILASTTDTEGRTDNADNQE